MKHTIQCSVLAYILINSSLLHSTPQQIYAPISFGELVDKITILTIKTERITDQEKLQNVLRELELLQALFNQYIGSHSDIAQLMMELKITNEKLWDIEDLIRAKERIKDFTQEFIELARNVYITNDHRCLLKRKIDTLLGSKILEEKSYEAY